MEHHELQMKRLNASGKRSEQLAIEQRIQVHIVLNCEQLVVQTPSLQQLQNELVDALLQLGSIRGFCCSRKTIACPQVAPLRLAALDMAIKKAAVDSAYLFLVLGALCFPVGDQQLADALPVAVLAIGQLQLLAVRQIQLGPLVGQEAEHGDAPEVEDGLADVPGEVVDEDEEVEHHHELAGQCTHDLDGRTRQNVAEAAQAANLEGK